MTQQFMLLLLLPYLYTGKELKAVDYGYAAESCCLWGIMDINDNTLIIYRELYKKGLTGEELGAIITDMETEDPFSVNGVLDTAAWARTGTTGPTVGESLIRAGHKLRRADKNRIQGKIQIHEYLKVREQVVDLSYRYLIHVRT